MDRLSARAGKGHGMASVGGQTACEADLLFVIVDGGAGLMRLATWNVNSLTARMPRVTDWIEAHQPDMLCMQETKQADDKFPEDDSPRSATSRRTMATGAGTASPSSAGSG